MLDCRIQKTKENKKLSGEIEILRIVMDNMDKKMTNCPKCSKPILNGGMFTSTARFNMRCPWCQTTLEVIIQPKITTGIVRTVGNELRNGQKDSSKFPEVDQNLT